MATTNHVARNLLRPNRAPRLPSPSPVYSRENIDQFQSALRLYFNELDSNAAALFGPFGARFLNAVYGSFSSDQDQTAANTTTAYAMTLNTTDYANGVSVASNSRLTVTYPGVYNVQFSAQFTNADASDQDISVWFRKNGTDIPNSNSQFSIISKHGSIDGALITALNFFVELLGGDYVEIMWSVTNTNVSIQHLAAQTSPTRPATPSVIATIAFVSSIPE
jgi:hypothetical protein